MISYILLIFVVAVLSIISILIFVKNYRVNTNQYFFAFILTVIVWILANYFENSELFRNYGEILLKIDFAFAALLAIFFYFFCLSFPEGERINKKVKIPVYLLGLLLSTASFSDLIIKNISFVEETISFERGVFFGIYALAIIALFTGGFWNLINKYRKAIDGFKRLQILYILIGLSISIFVAGILNLILSQFILVPVEIARIGIYSILIFCTLTSYAILKHHLFNVKVIATELFTFAIWIFLLARTLLAPTWQDQLIGGGLLALVVFFGILLIRAVIKEVEQREKLEGLTKKLEAANIRLRQLDEAKSEFLSIASHQLRTPLTSIKGLISMLQEGFWGPLNENQKKYLDQVAQSEERLLALIEELLDISRIESGKIQFEFKPTDLVKITKEIIKDLEPQAIEKHLYLRLEEPQEPLPLVRADAEKIKQVIQNLIDNAIKYTEEGGATINFKQEDGQIIFSIKDTGLGMPKEQLPLLFAKFQRGHIATSQHTEGAGLGLYWANKVIRAHNGRIWAESGGENQGSTFYFSLSIA